MIDDKFVTDMQAKTKIFNTFFVDQCQPLDNASNLPTNQVVLTQSILGYLDFNDDQLLQIIRALNINKAHGYDDICIRMIKICDRLLLKLRNSIKSSCYPELWKKSNDKELVENY